MIIRFLDFELHCATQELVRDGERQQLAPRTFDLLHHFLQHPGHIQSKDELLDAVWAGRRVEPTALKTAVMELRKCLSDHDSEHPIIRTVVRRGYVFLPTVNADKPDLPVERTLMPAKKRSWVGFAVSAVVLLALLVLWPERGDRGFASADERIALVSSPDGDSLVQQDVFNEMLRTSLLSQGYGSIVDGRSLRATLDSMNAQQPIAGDDRVLRSVMTAHGAHLSLVTKVQPEDGGWRIDYQLISNESSNVGNVNSPTLVEATARLVNEIRNQVEPGAPRAPLELDPDFGHAVTAELEGRYDDSIAAYETLLEKEPENLQASVRLAGVLAKAGYLGRSLDQHQVLLQQNGGTLTPATVGSLLVTLAAAQIGARRYDEAAETIDRIIQDHVPHMDSVSHGQVLRQSGTLARLRGNVDSARQQFARAKGLFTLGGSPVDEALLRNSMGSLEFNQGSIQDAIDHYKAGANLAARYGLISIERRLNRNLASALRAQGQWPQADELLTTTYQQAELLNDTRGKAYTALSHALVKYALGDGQAAVEMGLRAIKHAEALEDWYISAHSHDVTAESLVLMGAVDRSMPHFDRAIELASRIDSPNDRWLFKLQKNHALYQAGRLEDPVQDVEQALETYDSSTPPSYSALALFYRGEYQRTASCDSFAEALDAIRGHDQFALEAETGLTYADCLIDHGQIENAQSLVDQAGVWKPDYYLHAAVTARLLWRSGQAKAAIDHLNRAKDLGGDHWTRALQQRLVSYTAGQ